MLIIQDKHNCCGCGACEQICPRHCIIMKEDNEGFLYPVINQKDCINCGLCEKVCQYINPFESKIEPLSTYAFVSGDTEKRDKSSSGGLFSQLADSILSNGGYVVGASFDANWNVALSCIEKTEQLDSLRRSKYVQASVGNIFIEVKKLLEEGKTVLFCSTPCQVNGLNHFLRSKEYPNLICVDFTCHAVPRINQIKEIPSHQLVNGEWIIRHYEKGSKDIIAFRGIISSSDFGGRGKQAESLYAWFPPESIQSPVL